MKVNLRNARALCTAAEFDLVAASGGEGISALSEARLKQKIVRARALRDKYRDLLRRQRLAARQPGAKLVREDANARTASKAALFEQALARFVERLAQVRDASKRRATGKAAQKKAPVKSTAARKTAGGKASARKSATGKAAAKAAVPQRSSKAPAAAPLAPKVQPVPARGFVSEKAAQSARNVRLKSMHARHVQAHVSSRGRRAQAKRDSRPR